MVSTPYCCYCILCFRESIVPWVVAGGFWCGAFILVLFDDWDVGVSVV